MNFKNICDQDLLQNTKRLAREEQWIGIEILHHLREIESRRLFATLGFSSLFEYATRELGYPEASAYRRVSAMRLLRDVPECEASLQGGLVNVSTLSQVQSFLKRSEKTYSKEQKLELVSQVFGKSSRETEKLLAKIEPEHARPEKARVLNEEETEVRLTVSRELMEKLERLQNLMGHKEDTKTYVGLIEELADLALKKLDPQQKKSLPTSEAKTRSRSIPESVRRAVWKRDLGICTHQDPVSKRRCISRHALQLDHAKPYALGGTSDVGNLRLRCATHNRLAAIQIFGLEKMRRHWKPLV